MHPNQLLRFFNLQLHKTSSLLAEKAYFEGIIKRLSSFYETLVSSNLGILNNDVSGIVFSKDRAMQLHALLSSYFNFAKVPAPLTILYTYSSSNHKKAYEILQEEFKEMPIYFVAETSFKTQLTEQIEGIAADRIFFLTDDGIFVDEFDLSHASFFNPVSSIFSLRLGPDMDYCYTYRRDQDVPEFVQIVHQQTTLMSWTWGDMKNSPDWYYPLSVDATIFFRKELLLLLKEIEFKSPNTLESALQLYLPLFIQRKGVCYNKTKYINIPCNIVQNDFKNVATGLWSSEALLQLFLEGKRIRWNVYKGMKPKSIQESSYLFE